MDGPDVPFQLGEFELQLHFRSRRENKDSCKHQCLLDSSVSEMFPLSLEKNITSKCSNIIQPLLSNDVSTSVNQSTSIKEVLDDQFTWSAHEKLISKNWLHADLYKLHPYPSVSFSIQPKQSLDVPLKHSWCCPSQCEHGTNSLNKWRHMIWKIELRVIDKVLTKFCISS